MTKKVTVLFLIESPFQSAWYTAPSKVTFKIVITPDGFIANLMYVWCRLLRHDTISAILGSSIGMPKA